MPITSATIEDREAVREALVAELAQKKSQNPAYRVIDIGGRHNPWADSVTDAYADIFQFETDRKLYVGDVNAEDVWREIEADGPYDFAIISHVLEDVHYPMTGLRWLPRVAKAGFVGLPNRHTEFSNGVSNYWLGQAHHTWIFLVVDEGGEMALRAVPKLPCVEYFNMARPAPLEADEDLGPRDLPWLRPELAGRDNEFAVRWEGDIPFEVPDYSLDLAGQVDMYRTLLVGGVEDGASSPSHTGRG